MSKDYYKNGKWFYPLQNAVEEYFKKTFTDHWCNWQCISKDIVVEFYVARNDNMPEPEISTMLVCHYRASNRSMVNIIGSSGEIRPPKKIFLYESKNHSEG